MTAVDYQFKAMVARKRESAAIDSIRKKLSNYVLN
jgi:hypothetical protein